MTITMTFSNVGQVHPQGNRPSITKKAKFVPKAYFRKSQKQQRL
ncbi:hypothetical protein T03_9649 [Trichinella britovi]|uniref:Uncharacterized protein n=1 Tax=Trichinella britovi TaxID=45882 RepID=A0A0V1AJN6_TRIBR|nr:hypothetical protein T03_9649 [Trichinella britovi]